MAHEYLNFNLHLKENKENEWQPVLGASEHNTFFMIYVRFNKIKEGYENEMGKKEWMYDCTFRIQNFRGTISFGFCGVPNIGFPNYKPPRDIVKTSFSLELKAFCHNEYVEKKFYEDKPIDKTGLLETLYTVYMPEDLYDSKNPLKSKYLNPYRYMRDGDEVLEIGYRSEDSKCFIPIDDNIGGDFGVCSPNLSKLI